jgi:hypothetical protein
MFAILPLDEPREAILRIRRRHATESLHLRRVKEPCLRIEVMYVSVE